MPLKSIYLVPHGGVIIPGMEPGRDDDPQRKAAADKLLQRMEQIGQEIRDDNIEIVFITSPHGYMHPTDVLVNFNSVLEGWQYFHEKGEVQQQIFPANSQLAQIFHLLLEQEGIKVSPVILADANFPIKISWGEGIPLHFISSPEGPQVVMFSLPMNAGEEGNLESINGVADVLLNLLDAPMMEEHNVSVVISGDLSHRHDSHHEYGFHDNAQPFDEGVMEWIDEPTPEKYMELLNLHDDAASCGIFGMGLIQRMLERLEWQPVYSDYALPTYFGMAVSCWKPEV